MAASDLQADAGASNYDRPARVLHWLVAALLAVQFVTAFVLPDIKVDTVPDTVVNLHFSLGIVIFIVMAIRLVRRFLHPVAVAPRDAPAWERFLARATHLAFYAILLVAPFLGWAAASAHSVPVRLFGLLELPAIAPRRAGWGLVAGDIHGYAMWTLLGLVALHAAAACFHHFVRHDEVLERMLPWVARRS